MKRMAQLTILGILIVGCERRPRPPQVAETAGTVVASIDSKVITDQDLLRSIEVIKRKFPREFATHPEKKSLLNEMIHVELLAERALQEGLDKRFEFKTRLADLYVQDLSERLRANLKDSDLKDYYNVRARTIDQISARHILIRTDSNDRATAQRKMAEIYAEAKKSPAAFADLATKYSQDNTASRGGDLGFFAFDMMVEPFAKAAFALKKPGDISPIVETHFGFHIIQLIEDRRGFEANKAAITDQYLRAKQREIFDAEVARLRKGRRIEIYEEALLKTSPLPEIMTKDADETLDFKPSKQP